MNVENGLPTKELCYHSLRFSRPLHSTAGAEWHTQRQPISRRQRVPALIPMSMYRGMGAGYRREAPTQAMSAGSS